ncbi:SH3-like domain-containing protein [Mycolicibacterium sediminis]|uniref:Nitrile hydratase accessory protein n=1 Tax=Mycolicibacterium sediminis TaxID=1286180 RepID=A0A7I7QTP9_9MYCO|nr:SH3-like domain-containing protein [Mycolicibacterium sediminis]BBY29701.1 nitrile hydratase accessory protein [Mycolicibacterium sediminis]
MSDSAVFAEPWEARTFAMVRILRDTGVISAAQWTAALTAQLEDDRSGGVDYRHWLGALEGLLTMSGLVPHDELMRHRAAWRTATERTAHGEPIEPTAADFPDRTPGDQCTP